MKSLAKEHFWAVILAVMAGVVILLPQIIFISRLGADYRGIYMLNADAELHYLASMRELYDGNPVGNAYYFEEKTGLPNVYFTSSESLLALPGVLLGLSAVEINLVYKFILPAMAFLLVYALLLRLTSSRLWANAGAALVVFGSTLFSLPDVLHLLNWDLVYTQFALFARPVHPELTFLAFAAYIYVLLHTLQEKDPRLSRNGFVLLSAIFGLSFYLYFYDWTYILAVNFSVFLLFIWQRKYRSFALNMVGVTAAGMLLGARVLYEVVAIKFHPLIYGIAGEYLQSSHTPVVSIGGVVIIALFLIYLSKKFRSGDPITAYDQFVSFMLIATLVSVNQQVLTGVSLQSGHYHWYFNVPVFALTIAYLGSQLPYILKNFVRTERRFDRAQSLVAVILVLLSMLAAGFVQYSSYENNFAHAKEIQDYAHVFGWIDRNAARDAVVMANAELSDLIPVYTSANVLEDGYGKLYLLSRARREYGNDDALRDLGLGKKPPFRLDYVVWNRESEPSWQLDRMGSVAKVASFGRLEIYRVKQNEKSR